MPTKRSNIFISNPTGLSGRTYGVSVKYFKGHEETPYKRIDYEVRIQLERHEHGWLMCLNKEKIFFNQHEQDTISERLAVIVSQSLYPVETVIDGWGKQTGGIVNHEVIMKRWEQNRIRFINKYQGETAAHFVEVVDKKIKDSSYIQQSMNYDLFWNLFFHPKYMSYGTAYQQQLDMYLSVVPYRYPLRFPGVQEIMPQITDYNAIQVFFRSGEMKAPTEVLPGKKDTDGCLMKLNVDFDLDKEHHFAMHTRAVLEIYYREGKYTERPVKKIQFTMYQL